MNILEILSDILSAETNEEMNKAVERLSDHHKDLLIMSIFKALKSGDYIHGIDLQSLAREIE